MVSFVAGAGKHVLHRSVILYLSLGPFVRYISIFSCISVVNMCNADIIGRRPVITMGISGVAVTTLFLGFSKSLMGVLVARILGTHELILS
jgi:hypothetical protein